LGSDGKRRAKKNSDKQREKKGAIFFKADQASPEKNQGMLQITYTFKKSTPHCFYANWGQRPYWL
jgi:hypothetical protein